MVRKQVYIHQRHEALLESLSRQRGMSQAEVIRRAIEREAGSSVSGPTERDAAAWEEAKRFMRSLDEPAGEFKEPLRWSRQDAYEDRLGRYDQ